MQPLDYICITDDTKQSRPVSWYRISEHDLTHEGGGTQAHIEAREWKEPGIAHAGLIDHQSNLITMSDGNNIEAEIHDYI